MTSTQQNAGLVPETHADFRSVSFWDGFFKTRGETPFEWYGDWKQLQTLIKPDIEQTSSILVAGCGNSDLSADMYDAGYHQITNLDFSRLVITNMMRRNLRKRPKMKWVVGDMTRMKFPNSSFAVVLDKGGLDALMGEDADEGSEAGQKFLQEVQRLLAEDGTYICISLLQAHVLKLLLGEFGEEWQFTLRPVPPTPDMAHAQLQPICVYVKRISGLGSSQCTERIKSFVKVFAKAPNAEQLSEIDQVLQDAVAAKPKKPSPSSNGHTTEDKWAKLHPSRRVQIEHVRDELKERADQSGAAPLRDQGRRRPEGRYKVIVLDVPESAHRVAVQECAVFLVPQGRESEWIFGSEEGQRQLAEQCSCKRLIVVSLGRGHIFGSSQGVQSEVSALVRHLTPSTVRALEKGVPIMTCQDGVGKRSLITSVTSPVSGDIVVEDVELIEGEDLVVVRRLVFVSNSNLIQSEVRLRSKTKEPGRIKDKAPHKEARPDDANIEIGVLCMEYHKHILAGLISGRCLGQGDRDGGALAKGILIGLGGGYLAELLCQLFQADIHSIELDPAIVEIAKQHFGLKERPSLKVTVGDGLVATENAAESSEASLDFLIVDAGSSDSSLAMSCPPPAFLEPRCLQHARRALKDTGLLVINCVTRSEKAFASALAAVQGVFKTVEYTTVENDVNRILFAAQNNSSFKTGFLSLEGYTKKLRSAAALSLSQAQMDELARDLSDIELEKRIGLQ